tara:strand:+ start:40 stop:801 length:762 start_codon:yes stop_codon:yes gene_type:complete
MGKYFQVEVKPTVPNVAAGQHAAFADNDLVFDWFAFDLPKGASKLLNIALEIRPKGDSGSTPNEFDLDLLFAKTHKGVAPPSIGTVNSAAFASAVNLSNHMVQFYPSGNFGVFEAHLDSTAFTQGSGAGKSLPGYLFQGEPDSGTNVGYDRFYVAGIAAGALDFRSETLINNGDLNGPIMTVNGTDPRLFMSIGDTVNVTTTADTSVSKSMGVIKSMTGASITLESAFTTGDVVHQDIVYNTTPIRILLDFEK